MAERTAQMSSGTGSGAPLPSGDILHTQVLGRKA